MIRLIQRLPLPVLYAICRVLGFVAHHVLKYRLRVVRRNIDLCFPQRSARERRRIVSGFYRHLSEILAEALWFGGCQDKQRLRRQRLVQILNPEVFNALAADGRSVVILSSHLGNWELSGGILNYNYTDTPMPASEQNYVVVYKALTSPWWNDFMRRNRTAPLDDPDNFEGCIETHEVLRYIVAHHDQQKFYNFITDQRPYRAARGSVPVTFLGQPCQSMAAAAHLAQRFGFAAVYQRMRRTSRGHYTIEYVPLATNAAQSDVQCIMDRYYALLSADIEAQPEQYLWSHKRFG